MSEPLNKEHTRICGFISNLASTSNQQIKKPYNNRTGEKGKDYPQATFDLNDIV